jgi:glycerophosphoryl diester phosphodiesterase
LQAVLCTLQSGYGGTVRIVPLVIGHRGAPRAARENTIEAFEAAARAGADMVELDVRRTADGALVVHHDAVLGDGRVIVATERAALPEWLPDLADALVACTDAGMTINIEIKNSPRDPDFDPDDTVAAAVVALVQQLDVRDRVLVSSFNRATIDLVRSNDPRIPTGWLLLPGSDAEAVLADVAAAGHAALHPHDTSVTAAAIAAAHDAGLVVNTWTVDDPDRMRVLAEWGIDGIVTNVPDVAVAALRSG